MILGIGFWGTVYCHFHKESRNSIGHDLGSYIRVEGFRAEVFFLQGCRYAAQEEVRVVKFRIQALGSRGVALLVNQVAARSVFPVSWFHGCLVGCPRTVIEELLGVVTAM